jgi:ABC-type multidrug transport system fused ATPase/permease subunit
MKRKSQHLFHLLLKFSIHLSTVRKLQLIALLFLMVVASITEVISIGALIPFLAVISSPNNIDGFPLFFKILNFLGLNSWSEPLPIFTFIFLIASIFAGLTRVFLIWFTSKTAFAIGADISKKLYARSLVQPYWFHINENSSNLINVISNETNLVIYNAILPLLTLVTSFFLLIFISSAMIFINPFIAIKAIIGFGVIYLLIVFLTRNNLKKNGELISKNSAQCIKTLQEGLGGIRDVLIGETQYTFLKIFQDADSKLRKAQGLNLFLTQSPRYFMESLGMVLVITLAYTLTINSGFNSVEVIPTLGFLALAVQRLLPALQQGYVACSNLVASSSSLCKVVGVLDLPDEMIHTRPLNEPLPFNNLIELKEVSFRYPTQGEMTLKNISFSIKKGERVGFIGRSGSGKSTLMDIILGLLEPTGGSFRVDGILINKESKRAWQLNIANVSQSIYLADSSVEENIAFGVSPELIDKNRVKEAAKAAELSCVIKKLPESYATKVGERGVRFSGGQRQRIGIARALYKNASIIIFDEATSSLDGFTEDAIIDSIENLDPNITVLMIAHRLSTLRNCSKIIELDNGIVTRIIKYQDLLNT